MYQDTKKTSNEIVLLHGICRFCRPVVDGDIHYMVGILSNLEMAQHFTVSICRHGDLDAIILLHPRSSSLFGHGALHRR